MTVSERTLPIAVIGAGFSGTAAALQLLAALPPERPVLLCERAESFGRGLAYATGNPHHLLNLRAANMSAFPDRPGDFEAWLARTGPVLAPEEAEGIQVTPAGTFAARGLYGRYLAELLTGELTRGTPRLRLLPDDVTDLEPVADGFRLRAEGGAVHAVAGAVLAMGNLSGAGEPRSRHRADLWNAESFGRLHPDRPVLIVGTGLSMVDAVTNLRRHGFSGPIVAVSRRGLLPNMHAPVGRWSVPDLGGADLTSLTRLTARVRREVARAREHGEDWRAVVDALRPITDFIWRGLPESERSRFLRHLRPFWDVHRHRTAPPVAELIEQEIVQGTLSVRAGRILDIEDRPAEAIVRLRPRGGRETRLAVQCILDATGVGRVAETGDPLLRRLIARGLVRPGPFGIGLDAAADYRALGSRPSARLWTLGPLLRGVLWECVAVPDIRNEAVELATAVAAALYRAEAA